MAIALLADFKVRAADGVVDDVGAVAIRLVTDVSGNVGSRGINHLDGGGCMPAEFLARALYRENARPPHGRKLDCRLTHLAVAPEYEDHVPSFDPAGFDQPVVGRDERETPSAPASRSDTVEGFSRRCAGSMTRCFACVPSRPIRQLPPGAPDFLADEFGRPLPHDSGIVPARGARPYRLGHGAQHSLHIAGIDAGADDLNDRRERVDLESHIDTAEIELLDAAGFLSTRMARVMMLAFICTAVVIERSY